MLLIQTQSLSKRFGALEVLRNIEMNINSGEQWVLQGASGSGKSTLLYLLGGLTKPSSGNYCFNGQDLQKFSDAQLAEYRNKYVGFVFQFHFLLSSVNSIENILLPAKIGGHPLKNIKSHVEMLSEQLGVGHCLKKYPYELSGGEQQRINIIRALSLKPKLLLCDEPTGNLDSHNTTKVVNLLQALAIEYGSTLIMVTHDEDVASHFINRFSMVDGRLKQA